MPLAHVIYERATAHLRDTNSFSIIFPVQFNKRIDVSVCKLFVEIAKYFDLT